MERGKKELFGSMGFSALSASVSSLPSFPPWRPKTARQGIRPKEIVFLKNFAVYLPPHEKGG